MTHAYALCNEHTQKSGWFGVMRLCEHHMNTSASEAALDPEGKDLLRVN